MGKLIFLFVIFFQVLPALSQDKVLLLNGSIDRGKIIEETDDFLKLKIYKNGGKEKIISYDKYRIFSTENIAGEEIIHYKMDSTIGNFYSENQMKMYIFGERDARNNFNNNHHFLLGGICGGVVSLADTYRFTGTDTEPAGFFKISPTVVNFLAPFAVTIVASVIKTKIQKHHVSDLSFLASEEYQTGFNKIRRSKKIKGAFFGSIMGVAAGLTAYQFGK